MNGSYLTRATVYALGLLHLALASVLLYFAAGLTQTSVNELAGGMLILLLSGLGGAAGVALIWKAGRVTWQAETTPRNKSD